MLLRHYLKHGSFSGRDVTAIMTQDGNTLICVEIAKNHDEKSTKTVREFSDHEVIQTMEIFGSDVICLEKFKRLE